MKIIRVSADLAVTINMGEYNSVRLANSMAAELDGKVDPREAMRELHAVLVDQTWWRCKELNIDPSIVPLPQRIKRKEK